jgi:ABC-type uncharacterized transport system involved in gliding motility auxiliary subunit
MKDLVSRIVAAASLVMLIVAASLYLLGAPGGRLPALLFASGVGLLVVVTLANARTVVELSRKRSARRGANAVLMTLVFTSILVIVQAISVRHTVRHDVTRNKRFTLSEHTTILLDQLREDVTITAFFLNNSDSQLRAASLLSMFSHHSEHIQYTLVDPDHKPQIAERYRARNGQLVVEYKTNRRIIDRLTEEQLTNAILFATRESQKSIYFLTGHDEKRIESEQRSGFSYVRESLADVGFAVHELSLLDVDAIPSDCTVLVLAGPKKELLQNEAQKVAAYLSGGGNALFLLDPRRPISALEVILAQYHITMENVVLLDELVVVDTGNETFDATFTKIRRYERHPITNTVRSITIFPMARPVSILPVEGDLTVRANYLAVTEKSAWGETDLNSFRLGTATRDETDVPAPLAVAAVAERTQPLDDSGRAGQHGQRSRIVVVGDSDFATNRFLGLLGNGDFLLNSVQFLAEEEIVIPISLKAGLGERIYISVSEGRLVFVACLVLMPLMVAAMGGYVLFRKRRM